MPEAAPNPGLNLKSRPSPSRPGIEYRRHSAHHPRQQECTRQMESSQKRARQIRQALVAGFAEFLRRPALDLLPIVLT